MWHVIARPALLGESIVLLFRHHWASLFREVCDRAPKSVRMEIKE